jgi:hypothetical protein
LQHGEGLGRIEKARDGKETGLLRGVHNRGVSMRGDNQPTTRPSPTCDGSVKVPAPISIRSPKIRDKMEMLSNGRGELRGISTIEMPALSNAEQIDSASAG